MCVMLLAAVAAGCGKKQEKIALNTPARPPVEVPPTVAPPPPGPPLPALSADACALVATYVRTELGGEFGLPLMTYVQRAPKSSLKASELSRDFAGDVNPADAKALAASFTSTMQQGEALTCDWRAVGLPLPVVLMPDGKDYIRFRTAIAGDVAILDIFSNAGPTRVGTRCAYKRAGAAWQRSKCVLTALS
jgi:hypothetical protein